MTWKRLKRKETKWDCHQICQMHIQSMESQDHSFLAQRNVSEIFQLCDYVKEKSTAWLNMDKEYLCS